MTKTQNIRRLFLFSLVLWGIVGGLVSFHTCLKTTKKVDACCCDNVHFLKKEINQGDCCKTISSYVGIPLYFIKGNSTFLLKSFFHQLQFPIDYSELKSFGFSLISIHPPPEISICAVRGSCVLAMRI